MEVDDDPAMGSVLPVGSDRGEVRNVVLTGFRGFV